MNCISEPALGRRLWLYSTSKTTSLILYFASIFSAFPRPGSVFATTIPKASSLDIPWVPGLGSCRASLKTPIALSNTSSFFFPISSFIFLEFFCFGVFGVFGVKYVVRFHVHAVNSFSCAVDNSVQEVQPFVPLPLQHIDFTSSLAGFCFRSYPTSLMNWPLRTFYFALYSSGLIPLISLSTPLCTTLFGLGCCIPGFLCPITIFFPRS